MRKKVFIAFSPFAESCLVTCHEEYNKIIENETNETTWQYVAKAGFTVFNPRE